MAAGMNATRLGVVTVSTPIGPLTIVASERGVLATTFDDDPDATTGSVERAIGPTTRLPPRALSTIRTEITRYFDGKPVVFSTPPDLRLVADGFPRRVLEVTATIPYAEMWTYGDVAGMAGNPGAARAAGNALGRCPIELFVPCHRVVHAGRTLGGYGRFEERKLWLLRHEGAIG
jgi:methylated-DNA-[protein]-cysteine S-methyltransferase